MHTIILGFDAFDPARFERLSEAGKLPNLTRYASAGGYARLTVANPPQTEVSWTSIATGLDPGGHGIFDFVHRDPATYTPYASLLPTRRTPLGTQFVPPCRARTIFEEVARQGYSATVLWWPATFPAQPQYLARTIPGLGTPDIRGRIGVGTVFSTAQGLESEGWKTPVERLHREGQDRYRGTLRGPASKKRGKIRESAIELHLDLIDDCSVRLTIGDQRVELFAGTWSPIVEVPLRLGWFASIRFLTRFLLTAVRPNLMLYSLPPQIHPLHTPWRYASPRSFAKETWAECGPFLTLGWPQDTTALEEGIITDEQFLQLCQSIFDTRRRVLSYHLERFQEGILASIFDSLDRIQHMFWRDRPDLVDEWYVRLDDLVGSVTEQLPDRGTGPPRLFVLSDHGFSEFAYRVHLNRCLIDLGFLSTRDEGESGSLDAVNWSCSQAYAIGLNSLYLNLAGREGKGSVPPELRDSLLATLRNELLDWRGPDGQPVVQRVVLQNQAFTGPLACHGPDMVIGYSPGYRASSETGLGKWGSNCLERNDDHWGADHCIDAEAVPGVLFSNCDISDRSAPSYRHIPELVLGKDLDHEDSDPPPAISEDHEIIEKRLEGLGYL